MSSDQIKRQFEAAVQVIQNLPKDGSFKPSNELMLKFYGYYKQATVGKCTASKPSFWDVVGKAKWEAWNTLGTLSSDDAMLGYVDELKQIIETMPQTDEVNGLLKELDSFYTLVDLKTGETIPNGHSVPPNGSLKTQQNGDNSSQASTRPMNSAKDAEEQSNTSADEHSEDTEASSTNGYAGGTQVHTHANTDSSLSRESVSESRDLEGVVNGLDLIEQSNSRDSVGKSASESRVNTAPDLIHQGTNGAFHSDGASMDSDTDSEVYLDSSDIIPTVSPRLNDNHVQEKTVDLLESCPRLSSSPAHLHSTSSSEPAGAASSDYTDHSSHSYTGGSSVRPREHKSKQHSVSFAMPESSDFSTHGDKSDINEKLRMALLNMQQEISSLDKRLSLVEQITVNQRKRQISEQGTLMATELREQELIKACLMIDGRCKVACGTGSIIESIVTKLNRLGHGVNLHT